MPYVIRKIRNQNAYTVKNKETGKIHSHHTSRKNALAQVRLLKSIGKGNTPERMRMLRRIGNGRGGMKKASVKEPAISEVANTPGLLQKIHNTVHRSQEDFSHPKNYTLRDLPFHTKINERRMQERFEQVIPLFEALNDAHGTKEPFYDIESLHDIIKELVEEDSPILYLPEEQQIDWFVQEMADKERYIIMEILHDEGIELPEERITQLIDQAHTNGLEDYNNIVQYIQENI